jgi:hypothetical protein
MILFSESSSFQSDRTISRGQTVQPMPITSMDGLPKDVQDRESGSFDFGKVKSILIAGYYRGPAVHKDHSKAGMRAKALRGDHPNWRNSILRKATETDLLKQTPKGYATTPHGHNLLEQITVCDNCGSQQEPYGATIRTGRFSGYYGVHTQCPQCDDPLSSTNVEKHVRDDELEEAVEVMESHNVVCYLNGKSIDQVKQDLGL